MERLLCAVLLVLMLTKCNCNLGPINRGVDTFNKELEVLKVEISRMDSSFLQNNAFAKKSLQNDFIQHINRQVKEAMAEFRSDESLPKLRSPRVDSELRRLKQGQQMMKRQLSSMKKSLRKVTGGKEMYRDEYFNVERKMAETCSQCDRDNKLVKKVLEHCERLTVQSSSENDVISKASSNLTFVLERLNSKCKEKIKDSLTMSEPVKQTPIMKHLYMIEYMGGHVSSLNLHSNHVTKHIAHEDVITSLCFILRLGWILFGTLSPDRIKSLRLAAKDQNTLREGVWAMGMAVDEGRELVFIATWRPEVGISRMTTRGDNFTVIREVTGGYRKPVNIAVNPRHREVYAGCFKSGMIRLSYDGKVLRTLTSSGTPALSFHGEGNVLYFNDGRSLKKMSMLDEVVSDVTVLAVEAFTLAYYNNTVYYGGGDYVGAVQLGEKVVNTQLARLQYSNGMLFCLAP